MPDFSRPMNDSRSLEIIIATLKSQIAKILMILGLMILGAGASVLSPLVYKWVVDAAYQFNKRGKIR